MLEQLKTTRVSKSRIGDVDFADLGFGKVFSDHMFSMVYHDGAWQSPEILPFGPVAVHPSNSTLHYGQSVFEGLKAFRGADAKIRLFRPDKNVARMDDSCDRLCIPRLPQGLVLDAVKRLVALDHEWVPAERGQSLYIRPIIYSDEGHLEVRPAERFRLLIFTAPVHAYFSSDMRPVSLKAEESYTRSAPGGVGYAKTAGNYGASLYPGQKGRDQGYAQVLWLDGQEHRYVEEVGAMNIFFRFGDTIVTPDLRGTILPGVTRDSVIQILRARDYIVEERRVSIDEVVNGSRDGTLREVFGAGTAAVVSPVGTIGYQGGDYAIGNGEAGDLTRWLYEEIIGIQTGEIPDQFNWCPIVEPQA